RASAAAAPGTRRRGAKRPGHGPAGPRASHFSRGDMWMAKHRVTLIPGDGTGPELAEAMLTVLDATGVDIEWERVDAGADVMEKYGTPLPDHVLESVRRNKVAIKGPITTPVGSGFRSVNVALRKELDL